jgi:hypothetical protein
MMSPVTVNILRIERRRRRAVDHRAVGDSVPAAMARADDEAVVDAAYDAARVFAGCVEGSEAARCRLCDHGPQGGEDDSTTEWDVVRVDPAGVGGVGGRVGCGQRWLGRGGAGRAE